MRPRTVARARRLAADVYGKRVRARARSFVGTAASFARRHPAALAAAQLLVLAVLLGLAAWGLHGDLADAGRRLRDADASDFVVGCFAIGAYYLLFVLGWMRILGAWGAPIGYGAALRAEMVSMLAKYVPGGVWTPAARVVAARRAGIVDAGLVTASILVEAGLSAVAGVLVFVVSLAWVRDVDAPIVPLLVFGGLVTLLLHPRVFTGVASRVLKRFGGRRLPPLPPPVLLGLVVFYCCTWVVGGVGLFFLVRAVGGEPRLTTIAFLGGVSAVGAIVAVLSVFAPSGLGPREASMYGLLLAVTSNGAALGATVLNRLAITLVEVLLLVAGAIAFRLAARPYPEGAER